MTKRVVAYMRVSTFMQERDGVSLDQQLDMARRFCEARGMELVGSYCDTMSGSDDRRPELARLEQDLDRGVFDAVVVYKLDRLSRDPAHYHQLLQHLDRRGVGLASLTQPIDATSTMGRFIMAILIAAAEMEAATTADRVRDSIRFRATQGRIIAGRKAPLGYTYHKAFTDEDGKRQPGWLEINPEEAAVVRWIFERFLKVRSVRQIIKEAAEQGICPFDRKRLARQTIYRVLRSPLYKGEYAALKSKTLKVGGRKKTIRLPRDQWLRGEQTLPAIVDDATWEAAQAILAETAQVHPRIVEARDRLPWTGLLRCECCGYMLNHVMMPSGPTKARTLSRYLCATQRTHDRPDCEAPAAVSTRALTEFLLPEIFEAVSAVVHRTRADHIPGGRRLAPKVRDTAKELAALQRRFENVQYMLEQGDITRETYEAKKAEIKAAMAKLNETHGTQPAAPPAPHFPESLDELWQRAEALPGGQGRLLRSLVDTVYVSPGQLRVVFTETNHPDWPTEITRPIYDLRTRQPLDAKRTRSRFKTLPS